ncbi:MAG: sterol desaturase family protein [Cyanothece sp. SIO2G6]|nr:sterol desaturase family protein [Cyanothece sp. SIO2G6]
MDREPLIRFATFFGGLVIMALWEAIAPYRRYRQSKLVRWISNLGLVVLNTVILRAVFPVVAVGFAAIASQNGWGLFNLLSFPAWLTILLSVIALDCAVYWQHVLFHHVPLFWRLHQVHHADLDFDVTTGLRFHPIEILLSMGIKLGAIALLGPPAVAVLIFEVVLNASSLFNHGNVSLPEGSDRLLRWIIVTPDMHRIHHAVLIEETNSNFGFNLPWWDRLFGTYCAQAQTNPRRMAIGLPQYQQEQRVGYLLWMLLLPFWPRLRRYQAGQPE